METYHKIQTLFKRHLDGPKKGRMIKGAWTTPELEYLADNQWEFTEKVDGTNIRIGWNAYDGKVEFGGRSNNAVIPKELMEYLSGVFTPQRFLSAGLVGKYTLFGEGYGPKIQGGGKYRSDTSFVLFDVTCDTMNVCQKHQDGLNVIQTVSTILRDSVSPVTMQTSKSETLSGQSESENKQPHTETSQSKKNTTNKRTESGTLGPSLESPSKSTTRCLPVKTDFVRSVEKLRHDAQETEKNSYRSLLTTVIEQAESGGCFANPAILESIRQSSQKIGLFPQECTCTVSEHWWLKRDAVNDIASKLGIESVPVLGRGTLHDAIDIVSTGLTWDRNGKMTNWGGTDAVNKRRFNGLKSQWGNFEAEGIVARPSVDLFDRGGNRIICKVKAVDFK